MPKERSVLLAPNEAVPFDSRYITYPMMASTKFDGNRLLIRPDGFWSRSLKPQPNKHLATHFKDLLALAKELNVVFDCEWYSHEMTFSQMQSVMRSFAEPIPVGMSAYVFDMLKLAEWEIGGEPKFDARVKRYTGVLMDGRPANTVIVAQVPVQTAAQAQELYQQNLLDGYEGLMLRSPRSKYKHGRCSLRECIMYKFKEFVTDDVMIVGFEQQKQMKPEYAESEDRTRDVMGYMERSHKQEHYEYIEEIGSVIVKDSNGRQFGACFARGFDPEAQGITWKNREKFIGKMCEIRYMRIGMKDNPRMAGITRLRPDKDV